MTEETAPPGAVATTTGGAVALPDFMSQFAGMFNIPTADELGNASDPMIILSLTKDGMAKVKRKGDILAMLPVGGAIIGMPVVVSKPQVYFASETDKAPACKSDDGIIGFGANGEAGEKHECKKCPLNQWNSDPKGGKGKACKQSVLLAISCCGNAKLNDPAKGDYYVVSDKPDHRWWYEAYDLGTDPAWADKYSHPGPVILRLTASSFAPWEKALADVKRLHESGKWPLEATVWMITWVVETQRSGHDVGVWKFQVAAVDENGKWWMEEALALKEHASLERMSDAGHESEGISRPEMSTAVHPDDDSIPY